MEALLKEEGTFELIRKAILNWDFQIDSNNPERDFVSRDVDLLHLIKFQKHMRAYDLMNEAKYILTSHQDRRNFMSLVKELNHNDLADWKKVEGILYKIRANKQRTNPVDLRELQAAVGNQNEEKLRVMFMTSDKLSDWFSNLDKDRFAERYKKEIDSTDEYVSFTDVLTADLRLRGLICPTLRSY